VHLAAPRALRAAAWRAALRLELRVQSFLTADDCASFSAAARSSSISFRTWLRALMDDFGGTVVGLGGWICQKGISRDSWLVNQQPLNHRRNRGEA
jgi:hypothetical protein